MEIADRWSSSLKKMLTVEKCECPLGYAGLSCEVVSHLCSFMKLFYCYNFLL